MRMMNEFDLRRYRIIAVNAKNSSSVYMDQTGAKKVADLGKIIISLLEQIEKRPNGAS